VRKVLQVLLAMFGVVAIFIAALHIVFGPASIPGAIPVNATMDSEERFYATLFLAFGVALLWCVKDIERKARVVYFLMLTFFVGGLARIVSLLIVGPPNAFFISMTAVELLLPLILGWMQFRIARVPSQALRNRCHRNGERDAGSPMRLPSTAHTSRPWRIHELTHDFRLEDVWALPTPGGPDDFPRLVAGIASGDPSQGSSRAARTLWAIRWKVGELLGWDGPDAGVGSRVPTLRDRLPADLRDASSAPDFAALPFTSLYLLENEFAAEIANRTMHGVLHLGWVPDQTGGYRGQLAVLVKPNGLIGTAYMAAIKPFRHLIVYPQMMQQIERAWRARARDQTPARA